jgi:trans-aconitate methyltransferase
VTDIHSFLSLARYYRRFIENFSKIAKTMTNLLKKTNEFEWMPECEHSFQTLKQKLTTTPVLALPDIKKTSWSFVMHPDRDYIAFRCKVEESLPMRPDS